MQGENKERIEGRLKRVLALFSFVTFFLCVLCACATLALILSICVVLLGALGIAGGRLSGDGQENWAAALYREGRRGGDKESNKKRHAPKNSGSGCRARTSIYCYKEKKKRKNRAAATVSHGKVRFLLSAITPARAIHLKAGSSSAKESALLLCTDKRLNINSVLVRKGAGECRALCLCHTKHLASGTSEEEKKNNVIVTFPPPSAAKGQGW